MRDPGALWHPSPNFGARRGGARPDMVVLHYTAMGSAEAARDWLCTPAAEVSAHYLISPRGALFQMVSEDQRAWHAGAGRWGNCTDVNSRSIGIELGNGGAEPFSAPQMACLEALLARILARWQIAPERVIGHSDMAPGRKQDPGRRFDWRRLARQGLAVWPQPAAEVPEPAQFRPLAARAGYTADVPDETLLAALRARFRPWASGPLSRADMALLAGLAARFPVDPAAVSA